MKKRTIKTQFPVTERQNDFCTPDCTFREASFGVSPVYHISEAISERLPTAYKYRSPLLKVRPSSRGEGVYFELINSRTCRQFYLRVTSLEPFKTTDDASSPQFAPRHFVLLCVPRGSNLKLPINSKPHSRHIQTFKKFGTSL